MKKMTDFIAGGLLFAAVLAGCADDGAVENGSKEAGKKDGVFSVVQVEEKALIATNTDAPQARAVAKGANGFAFRFGAALAETEIGPGSDDNLICSPYSVWLPLAALVNAADEASRPALLEAMGAGGIDTGVIGAADINTAASRMLYDLTKESDKKYAAEYGESYHNPLKIANAIFVDKASTLKLTTSSSGRISFEAASKSCAFAAVTSRL
jgi:serine protease inhibitor